MPFKLANFLAFMLTTHTKSGNVCNFNQKYKLYIQGQVFCCVAALEQIRNHRDEPKCETFQGCEVSTPRPFWNNLCG